MIDQGFAQASLRAFAAAVDEHADALTKLDAAIGDADHGSNLKRGMAAVVSVLDDAADAATTFKKAGMTLVSTVGGASGPLFGTFFLRMAGSPDLPAALRAGVEGVIARGKASPGEKTMLDALVPAVDALDGALADGKPLADALNTAAAAADAGRDATTPLVARKGRASYLGERSAGHQDPGATSAALLIAAAASVA